jgi:hypothetical protein
MHHQTIKKLQKQYGVHNLQNSINNGSIWKMEGSAGRHAMSMLGIGAVMLPKREHRDYYGNRVPPRDVLKSGTKGTYQNCANFWSNQDRVDDVFCIDPESDDDDQCK